MFGETTTFHVRIWNHPIETPVYKQMFQVPGKKGFFICQPLLCLITGALCCGELSAFPWAEANSFQLDVFSVQQKT